MQNQAHPARARLLAAVLVAALGGLGGGVAAQPTTEQMIEQLKQPRTRSLRNLIVEPAAPAEALPPGTAGAPPISPPASPPSLSLLVEFDFDSARVRPQSQEALSRLARALNSDELSGARFAVEGHTDAKGRADYNLRLSQRRAQAVRDVLVGRGVDQARLETSGKGSSEPAVPADPNAAENRRVRIINLQ